MSINWRFWPWLFRDNGGTFVMWGHHTEIIMKRWLPLTSFCLMIMQEDVVFCPPPPNIHCPWVYCNSCPWPIKGVSWLEPISPMSRSQCQIVKIWVWAITPYSVCHTVYRIIGNFRDGKFWRKCHLNFHQVLFSLFKDSQSRHLVGFIFPCFFFYDFREVANLAKIKPTRKNSDIRYRIWTYFTNSDMYCILLGKILLAFKNSAIIACNNSDIV